MGYMENLKRSNRTDELEREVLKLTEELKNCRRAFGIQLDRADTAEGIVQSLRGDLFRANSLAGSLRIQLESTLYWKARRVMRRMHETIWGKSS